MIRKVEGHNAGVCKAKDIKLLSFTDRKGYGLDIYEMPLFSTILIKVKRYLNPEDLILVYAYDGGIVDDDFIKKANQRGNEFYENNEVNVTFSD